jgi:glycine cleavage system protein P-like pyridoxal-binding family
VILKHNSFADALPLQWPHRAECILDLRAFMSVTAKDVAKRLMDF